MDVAAEVPVILDHARRDLLEVVSVVLARDGALFTAGERHVLSLLLRADAPTVSLFARLLGRVPAVFFLADLRYVEVPDIPAAARALCEAGLALDAAALAPVSWLVSASTVPQLKQAAAALGRPTKGLRAELVERLSDPDARPALVRPGLVLLHRGLLRRVARLYFHDSQGDMTRFVVARLGVVRHPQYTPTGGAGLFPTRGELLAWEEAMSRRYSLDADAMLADAPRAIAAIEATPSPPDWRRRFSARRYDEDMALAAANQLARLGRHQEAVDLLRRLIGAGARASGEAAQRLALCLEALGRAPEAASLCREHRDRSSAEVSLALERTGRRLAKAAKLPWAPLAPLRPAPTREVLLERQGHQAARPAWSGPATGHGPTPVEAALVAWIGALGRRAVHGENALWTTLFGLLFADVLFAPVPGMLPTPMLHAPLDLGSPGFAARRRAEIDATLAGLMAGEGRARLESALTTRAGEAIIGVAWDLLPPQALLDLVATLDARSLAGVMRVFAEDWRDAGGGLPDIAILPGQPVRLAGALPATVPGELLFVEVKGPTDSLRDGQRVWHHRLLEAGVRVEVWHVRATA